MQIQNNTISFTARCPEIKKAQWVCHKITENTPHFSSTKFEPFFTNFRTKNLNDEKKLRNMFSFRHKLIQKLNDIRCAYRIGMDTPLDFDINNLNQLKHEHFGNCGEDAIAARLILKMNGIDNVVQGFLKVNDKKIDHAVCMFNRDGSPFEKIINNQTILVDPWSGIVDFANNAFKKYKNMYTRYFKIPENAKMSFEPKRNYKVDKTDIEGLRNYFPEFVKKSPA